MAAADDAGYEELRRTLGPARLRARHARQPALLPRDAASPRTSRSSRPDRRAPARAARRGVGAHRRREAVRPRPASRRARSTSVVHTVFREDEVFRIDHYLGQGDGPEHPRLALRERDLRADLEPPVRRPRADHRGRDDRRRGARRLLRAGGRAARHRPEPPAAAARARGDGAAGRVRRRRGARREGEGAAARSAAIAGDDRRGTPCAASTRAGRSRASRCRATARSRASRRIRRTETYVALQAAGSTTGAGRACPFYVRTGKRLPKRVDRDRDPVPRRRRTSSSRATALAGLEPNVLRPAHPARRRHLAAVRREGARARASAFAR